MSVVLTAVVPRGLGQDAPRGGPTTRKADLTAEARRIAQVAAQRFGQGYRTRIDSRRHIVYISALDDRTLDYTRKLLADYHAALTKSLFTARRPWNVTVILPTVRDYRKLVPMAQAHGIYSIRTRTLLSISFSSVLVHEFTHALHHGDQAASNQSHAIWIVEGLARLFQTASLTAGKFTFKTGADLPLVQKEIKAGTVRPLAEFFTLDQKRFLAAATLSYGQAHLVMLYLQRKGKLKAFYQAYKAGYAADVAGGGALARTMGTSLQQVETNWRSWVLSQAPPWQPARQRRAHLGVKMRKTEDGVKIAGFLHHSAAGRANVLRVGDVVISLAGQPVQTPAELAAAVKSCQPGQIVDVEVIRNDRTVRLKHLLGVTSR